MAWLGRRKLAFIPLSRTNIQPPDVIPPDWPEKIMKRLFFDPPTDATTGALIPGVDRSVRAYFHTVSSGLADLDVVVLPPQTIAEQNVPPDALEATMGAQLRSEGFVGAAIVMLGGPGGGDTSEGVIVYRVQTTDPLGNAENDLAPLALLTKTALAAGQSFRTDGVTIDVASAVLGGTFAVQVETIAAGQLLSYGDTGVSDPVVVGFDDWQSFKFLFAGKNVAGENRIYALVA